MLWNQFMQRKHEVPHVAGKELYSMQTYARDFFNAFNPDKTFEKWAAVEVSAIEDIPPGMHCTELPAGRYAVFLYKGDARNAAAVFEYILGTWLPASEYELDERPHFEVLGDNYSKNDPASEEEIWIPIKTK